MSALTGYSNEEGATTLTENAIELTDMQHNSISMLNYLAVLTQEINASKNSRLYLEEAYSFLINNTYPSSIDSTTQSRLASLLDTLEDYRMISVKRDRLQFIHEQRRALVLSEHLPRPLGLDSIVELLDYRKLAASIISKAADSILSEISASGDPDLQYLQDRWELDNEEAAALHNSRKETFNYMITIVGEYNLPGELALSENAANEFVSWKNNSNALQRIQFLETNRETYQALGVYWLVLAESYYDNGDYAQCLEAVAAYESLSTRIFRKDYELARVLPLAIVAAGAVMDGAEYIETTTQYANKILANTDPGDWSLHYFAALIYVDLFARTNDTRYLEEAYHITLNNVNYLVNKQKTMNASYLLGIEESQVPKDAANEVKAEINNFNKQIKEDIKTALPPIYEPLLLNCDLLFFLVQEMNVSQSEKSKIDGILHQNGERLFLIDAIDNLYRFSPEPAAVDYEDIEITFTGGGDNDPHQVCFKRCRHQGYRCRFRYPRCV